MASGRAADTGYQRVLGLNPGPSDMDMEATTLSSLPPDLYVNIYPITFHWFLFLFNPSFFSFSDPLAHLIKFLQKRPKTLPQRLSGLGSTAAWFTVSGLGQGPPWEYEGCSCFHCSVGVVWFMSSACSCFSSLAATGPQYNWKHWHRLVVYNCLCLHWRSICSFFIYFPF